MSSIPSKCFPDRVFVPATHAMIVQYKVLWVLQMLAGFMCELAEEKVEIQIVNYSQKSTIFFFSTLLDLLVS